jgi:hypothetical protein
VRQCFVEKRFSPENEGLINIVNVILEEYRLQGFRLSLRQVYYQMVARDLLPDKWRDKETGSKNNSRAYKNLGSLISDARQAGLIDWSIIEDRGRETVSLSHWDNPGEIVAAAANQFRLDKWEDQPYHIEVMVEKDALSGVLVPVCRELDISITANKGYSSSSTMYEIGQRLEDMVLGHDKQVLVLYLGDHDPSGIDMTRDVEDRLCLYSEDQDIEVIRLALNYDQVQRWNPPENPAKDTDSRFESYRNQFGESCWELDAVEPAQLADLVRDIVEERRDEELWDAVVNKENTMKVELKEFVKKYEAGGLK